MDTVYFAENWKHCSKIIFNCVNSIIRLIFNEKIVEKSEDCGSHKQCTGPTDVHCSQKKSQKLWLKKKKKKEENAEKWKRIHTNMNPNTHKLKVMAKVY